jgi:hypothetical protein
MLPTPDCSGSRLAGRRPRFTSLCRNSMMWPAIWREASSGGVKALLRSGWWVSTTATTLAGSTRR